MEATRLVLASSSPRRLELLQSLGFVVEVRKPNVDERRRDGESPEEYVGRLSREKALAVPGSEEEIIIAADTVVLHDGEIIGKPRDDADAARILKRLSGSTHQVMSGFCVCRGGDLRASVVSTEVRFRPLTRAEIDDYVAGGEPSDKAGAYGIQGRGAELVAEICGSFSNVVGLPLEEVSKAIDDVRS